MSGWVQLLVLVVVLAAAYRPLGDYMARVYASDRSLRVERWIYRAAGVDPTFEQRWTAYAMSLLAFSFCSVLVLYIFQRVQGGLPLSLGFGGVHPDQAFNTAASFPTNTNWQSYSGESTMGHLVQMSGLAVQNFVSAAVGMAVAVALVRGFTRAGSETIGNFWSDMVRSTVRILLPIAFVFALLFVSQGVVQNLHGFQTVETVTGGTQAIPGGPVASQEAIKELGNNGGGFYNANSAHPFENPSPLTNFFQLFLILVIPFALTGTFGKLVGNRKQGYVLAAVMALFWISGSLDRVALRSRRERGPPGARRREHGRQGGSVRAGRERYVRVSDHQHVDGFGGVGARLLHGVRRRGPAGQHHAVRGHARRRGGGTLRHAGAGAALGVHRRADGRPHAGIPRQEGRATGDEADLAVHPPGARPDPRPDERRAADPVGAGLDPQRRTPRPERGALRVHVGREQQRQRVRWPQLEHDVLQHVDRHRDAAGALRADRVRARPGRVAREEEARARSRSGPSRPIPCSSADCWSA